MWKKHTENYGIAQRCSYKDSRRQYSMQFPNCTATPGPNKEQVFSTDYSTLAVTAQLYIQAFF